MQNIERDNNVKYELYSNYLGSQFIQEPSGYSNDRESYERDTDSRAILSKIDVELEFYGDASTYLRDIYYTRGVQEVVQLIKYEKNKYTLEEEWYVKYVQQLDMTTYKEVARTGAVTVTSTEGGLFTVVDNRKGDDYDLLNDYSADDIYIGELTTKKFQPLGRKIFLQSLFETENRTNFRVNSYQHKSLNNLTDVTSRPVPMELVYSSNVDDTVTPLRAAEGFDDNRPHTRGYEVGETIDIDDFFFFRAERDLELKVKVSDLKYRITKIDELRVTKQNVLVSIFETRYNDEDKTDEIYDKKLLQVLDLTDSDILNTERVVDTEYFNISLPENGGLALMFTTIFRYNGSNYFPFPQNGRMDVYFNTTGGKLLIEDITDYTENITISKCVKPLDFFDRIIAKITGETGLFKSTLFESGGDYEYMVIDNGLWARGFPDTYTDSNDEEQSIQLSTSFEDAFDSFNYLEPLTWFTETVNGKEYVRIERAKYVQQNFIGIQLGIVDDIEYESSSEDYFSAISIGQEDDLEYEEINGMDETNGLSNFSTFISLNTSEYIVNCKYNIDSVGYELTRRYGYENYPKESTTRDDNIWLHDAKALVSGVITHKRWYDEDRFTETPIGVYDADTTWNLWLSPMNRLYYGHAYSVGRGLYHFGDKKITFGSSNANQNLITEKDGVVLSESGNLTIKDLENPRVEATTITLTFTNNQEIEEMFKGTTMVNGEEVPNVFGLIEYDEGGKKKYGRLISLDNSEQSTLTLIKARL